MNKTETSGLSLLRKCEGDREELRERVRELEAVIARLEAEKAAMREVVEWAATNFTGIVPYLCYKEMVDKAQALIASTPTPTDLVAIRRNHAEQILAALEEGTIEHDRLKAALGEKP
jgi:hypothetical protein